MSGMRVGILVVAVVALAAWGAAAQGAQASPKVEMGAVTRTAAAPAAPVAAPDLKRRFQVVRADAAPKIDGRLDDAAWAGGQVLRDFTLAQAWDDTSTPKLAADRTECVVLYDDKGLYVGVRALQDPKTIYTTIKENGWLRPDMDWQVGAEPWANTGCDEIEVAIDPELTLSSYYLFSVNPDGVKRTHYNPSARMSDGLYKRIEPILTNNDDKWQVATSRDEKGWYAEFFIPYSAFDWQDKREIGERDLYFDMVQDWTVMGFNVNRISHERREASSYSVSRGPAFFRDADHFANAYFRAMPASLEDVAAGDFFTGDDRVATKVRSRSDKAEEVVVAATVMTGGAPNATVEQRFTLAPGEAKPVTLSWKAPSVGARTVDVTLTGSDGRLLDRETYAFEMPAPVEVLTPKRILYEGEGDFYAAVTVNAPDGVDSLSARVTPQGGEAISAGTTGRLERGTYLVPFAVTGLPQGKYELSLVAPAVAGAPAAAAASRFAVIENPYALSLFGTAGQGTPTADVPEGFKALATDMPAREARRIAEEELVTLPTEAAGAALPWATDAMKAQGFVIFAEPATADVSADTLPRQAQADAPLRAFASGGEYEPIAFGIHALADLSGIAVTFTEMKNAAGAVIPVSQMDLRAERPDGLLVKPDKVPTLGADKSRRYFLTTWVAPGTAAGLYSGSVTFAAEGRATVTRPVSLLVLPMALDAPPLWYSIYGNISGSSDPERDYVTAADYKAHGLDNLTCVKPYAGSGGVMAYYIIWDLYKPTDEGYIPDTPGRWDLKLDDQFFKFLKDTQVRGPVVIDVNTLIRNMPCTAENAAGFERSIRQIEAKRAEFGLGEFVYHLVDEPNNHYTYDDGRYGRRYGIERVDFFGKALHNAGVRCYETMNSGGRGYDIGLNVADSIDIWCANVIPDPSLVDFWTSHGKEVWLYNYAGDGRVKGSRSTYGLYPLAIGATGVTQWVHTSYTFWNRDERKYVNTAQWEALREGTDDARYVVALDDAIARARAAGGAAAVQAGMAQADLDSILDAYPVVTEEKVSFEKLQDPEEWNKWRWTAASWILKLNRPAQ